MNTSLEQQAAKLAARPYSVEIVYDETTTGEPVVVASHPELPGCMAQGDTITDALAELAEARKEYVLSLLEDNLPVPGPAAQMATVTSGADSHIQSEVIGPDPEQTADSVRATGEKPFTISVVES